ncbi:MAG: recombinase family protein [Gemmataceae bacterium]
MARQVKGSAGPAIAYSYVRFSTLEQAKGDSLRRQAELRDAWLKKSGAVLDTSLTLRDEGVSAFTGSHHDKRNKDRHALAAFLVLVKTGRVRRGSYLIIESLDRLSREEILPALTLLLDLLNHGIQVVQLLPVETVFGERPEPMALMMAIMELSRGHSESRMKSERLGAAWRAKRTKAAESGVPLCRTTPAWLDLIDGKFVVREDRAAVVRRIYQLATDGYGLAAITKRLNQEGVPPIGRNGFWLRPYVGKLLRTRAVLGEYQPHAGRADHRRPLGDPIPNYFPPILSEEQWHAARAALTGRRRKVGRLGKVLNLFSYLAFDARDGGQLTRITRNTSAGNTVLTSHRAMQGVPGTKSISFPAQVFEAAILSQLREIDPRDILPGTDRSADHVMELAGKLGVIEGKIEKVKAEVLEGEEIGPLVDILRKLEANRQAVADQLAAARQKAASPLSEAWGNYRSLVDALATAPDQEDARLRLRASLRRIVKGIWCLFVVRGIKRIAAVQVWFEGGSRRDYLIHYTPAWGSPHVRKPEKWEVKSVAHAGRKGGLDLRKTADAAQLEKVLIKLIEQTGAQIPVEPDVRQRILDLRKQGLSHDAIRSEVRVGYATVAQVLKQAEQEQQSKPRRKG